MVKKFWMAVSLSLSAAIASSVGVWAWRKQVVTNRTTHSKEIISKSLANQDFVTARSALQGIADQDTRKSQEKSIRKAELEKALNTRDTALMKMAID